MRTRGIRPWLAFLIVACVLSALPPLALARPSSPPLGNPGSKPKAAARAVSTVPSYSFDPGFGKAVALRLAGARPGAVACDGKGLVYVAEYRCQRIHVFDGAGDLVRTIPTPETGALTYSVDLSVDASGNCVLLATYYSASNIYIYGPDGAFVRSFGVNNHIVGIGLDAAGAIYGVWDYYPGGRLYKWSQTGALLRIWTLLEGAYLRDVAISPTGDAFVTDEGAMYANNHLLRYTPDTTKNSLAPTDVFSRWDAYQRSVVVDNLGVVYTADRGTAHAVHRFYAASGDIGAANLVRPWLLAVDPGGNVYVVDDGTGTVERFAISPPRGSEGNPYPVDESTDSGLVEASTRTTNGRAVVLIPGFGAVNSSSTATASITASRGVDNGYWRNVIPDLRGKGFTVLRVGARPLRTNSITLATYTNHLHANAQNIANYMRRSSTLTGRDVVLVGYSMGGLWARALLDDALLPSSLADRIKGVVQIGTPNNGTDVAGWGAVLAAARDSREEDMERWNRTHQNTAHVPFCQVGGVYWQVVNHPDDSNDGLVSRGSLRGGLYLHRSGDGSPAEPSMWHAIHSPTVASANRIEKYTCNLILPQFVWGDLTRNRRMLDRISNDADYLFGLRSEAPVSDKASRSGSQPEVTQGDMRVASDLVLSDRLRLEPGAPITIPLTIDSNTMVVELEFSGSMPRVSLLRAGERYDLDEFESSEESSTVLARQGLSAGPYSLVVEADSSETVDVSVRAEGSDTFMYVDSSSSAAIAGSSVVVTATLETGDAGALDGVFTYDLDGVPSGAMSDDGLGGDVTAGDGVYSAAIIMPAVEHVVLLRCDARGVDASGNAVQRVAWIPVSVAQRTASLREQCAFRPVLASGSKLSGLALDVRLHPLTSADASVGVYADLYDENGELIAQPRAFVNLPPGEDTTVTLIADPYILHDNLTGPSRIFAKHVEVHALTDEVDVPVDEASDVATSEVYAPDDFAIRRADLYTLGANPRQECTATLEGTAMSTETTVTGVDVSFDGGSVWFAALASDGSFDSLSETFTISAVLPEGCWQVWARPRDGAGAAWDQADWGDHSVTIDWHAPLTVSSVATASGIATVSLEASDAISGIASTTYRVDGGPELVYDVPLEITMPGDYTISFWSVDNAGNTETSQTLSFTVPADITPPETTCDSPQGWVDSNFRVTLSATDSGSGVAYTRYRVGGGELATYTVPFALEGEGQHAISFFSVDAAGNVELARTATVAVDASAPRTSSDVPSSWCSGTVSVTLAATDAYSGVARTVVRIGDAAPFDYTGPFAVTSKGETNIEFSSIDRVGNVEATQTATVRIDTTPPETTCDSPQGWVDAGFRVALSATDSGSGVAYTRYRVGEGELATYTVPFALEGEGRQTVTFFSADAAGNVEPARATTIAVDASAPRTSSDAPSSWCSGTVTVTLAATDAYSGVARTVVRVGDGVPFDYDGPFAVTGEGATEVEFSSVDLVGNTEATQVVTVRIDRTAPVTVCDAKSLYRECATIALSVTDSLSGVAETEYRLDGGGWIQGTQTVVDAGGVHTLEFRSYDIADNLEQTHSVSFTVLDRFEDTDSRIAYRGTWAESADPLASGGSVALTGETGAAISVAFTGTRIDLVATRDFTLGIAQVTIDGGEPVSVDLYSPTILRGQVVFSAGGLAPGSHTLLLRHTGMRSLASAGSLAGLDAVEVAGTLTSASIPPLRVQESDRAFRFRGGWRKVYSELFSGGSARISDHRNARVDFEFYGTGVDLISARTPDGRLLEVTIDGGMPTLVDLRSDIARYQVPAWGVSGLSEGWHVVEADSPRSPSRPSRDGMVLVDGVDIEGYRPAIRAAR